MRSTAVHLNPHGVAACRITCLSYALTLWPAYRGPAANAHWVFCSWDWLQDYNCQLSAGWHCRLAKRRQGEALLDGQPACQAGEHTQQQVVCAGGSWATTTNFRLRFFDHRSPCLAPQSTLFNAIVENGKAAAANFPFCTIEPNVGMVTVPDARLQQLSGISKSKDTVRAPAADNRHTLVLVLFSFSN